jgi:hypothetical protein
LAILRRNAEEWREGHGYRESVSADTYFTLEDREADVRCDVTKFTPVQGLHTNA